MISHIFLLILSQSELFLCNGFSQASTNRISALKALTKNQVPIFYPGEWHQTNYGLSDTAGHTQHWDIHHSEIHFIN